MMIRNNKGFGSREILTVSTVCLILASVLLVIAIQTSTSEKYKVMEYNARMFGLSATTYQMENSNDVVYMMELLDNGLFSRVKNPFGGERYCSFLESKVEYEDEKKYVTLQCGNYLIDHQYIAEDKYQIYKVGKWSEKKPNGSSQQIISYNYKDGHKNGLDGVYDEAIFLYTFNKKMGRDYETIDDIPKKYQVYKKTLYRTKTLVETIDHEESEKLGD